MFSSSKQQRLISVFIYLLGIFIASAILFAQPGYARALGCGNADGPGGGRDPGDEISSCPDSYYCSDGKRYKQDKRERQDGGGSGWIWVRTAYAAGEGRRDVYDSVPSGGCVNNGPPVRVPSQDYLCAPASCTITANPSSITEGQSTKLIWSATSPDGSNYSGKISHSLGSDTYPVSQASSGNFSPSQSITYTFSGTFSSGPFSCSVPVVVTSVRPSVDLQVRKIGTTLWLNPTAGSPLRIGVSDEVELKWDSLNATSCTSGDFTVPGGSVNGRTSDVVEPAVGSTKPYTITCTNGSDTDLDSVVTVAAPPPTVTTQVQSNVTQTGATLNGTANPNGTATTGWFRYRTSSPGSCNDSFGTRVPSSGGTSLGSGTSGVNFSRAISGLVQNTTYYYCAIAENAGGKAYGAVRSFTMTAYPTPTVTLAANPASIAYNAASTLSWSVSGATSCTASNAWSGAKSASGGSESTGAVTSTRTYTLTCTGAGGSTARSATVTVAAPPPTVTTQVQSNVTQTGATLNGTANPTGTATTGWFRYRTSSPGSCNDSFGTRVPSSGGTSLGSGTSGVNFSRAISGLVQNTTYYYCAIAENAGGKAYGAVRSFTMTAYPPPTATLAANPASIAYNAASTLSWSVSGATSCTASNAWSGAKSASGGSESTGAVTSTRTYTLTCTGAGGSTARSATVTVAAPPPTVTTQVQSNVTQTGATLNGTANPNGTATTGWFRYRTSSPGSCNDSFGTRVPSSGGTSLGSGPSGVNFSPPPPTVTRAATPAPIAYNAASTLSWSVSGATSCTASNAWSGAKSASGGSESTGAVTSTRTYTLTCTGAGGSTARSATVTVAAPPPTVTTQVQSNVTQT